MPSEDIAERLVRLAKKLVDHERILLRPINRKIDELQEEARNLIQQRLRIQGVSYKLDLDGLVSYGLLSPKEAEAAAKLIDDAAASGMNKTELNKLLQDEFVHYDVANPE